MSGFVRRVLATVRGWWDKASTVVLTVVNGVVRVVRTIAVRALGAAAAVLAGIRQRHQERLDRDAGYRTALATGLSALLVTITPQPAVAAALAVLVSEHLGSPRQAQQAARGYDDEDEDEDDYEAYDTRRAWSSPTSRPAHRPWDRYSD